VQSNRSFEKLISLYSGTRYLDKAESRRFAIAQYWLGMARSKELKWGTKYFKPGDPQRPTYGLASEARRILHRIRLDDPTGKFAGDATMALANAYFEAKMYEDAADTYEDLRMNFPGSKHQFHAHLFELKSRLNSYYGSSYDAEPLIKANELLTRINTLYREQAKSEQAYLDVEYTRVRNLLANRDYELAQYFENRGENRAAHIMYEQVAEDYHDTQLATLAETRIGVVKEKPPVPEQHAQWLVNLFPQSEAAKPLIAEGNKESIFR
jgi:outer membrane protein assembly factor BamD (BamD/ComL family)